MNIKKISIDEKLMLMVLVLGMYLTGCTLLFYSLVGESISGAITANALIVMVAILMIKLIDKVNPTARF